LLERGQAGPVTVGFALGVEDGGVGLDVPVVDHDEVTVGAAGDNCPTSPLVSWTV